MGSLEKVMFLVFEKAVVNFPLRFNYPSGRNSGSGTPGSPLGWCLQQESGRLVGVLPPCGHAPHAARPPVGGTVSTPKSPTGLQPFSTSGCLCPTLLA